MKRVDVMGMSIGVTAQSMAYIIPGSGSIPVPGQTGKPIFKPTYRVVLGT
jgi:hypothetical protein